MQLAAAYSVLVGGPIEVEKVIVGISALHNGGEASRDPFFLSNLEHHEDSFYALLREQPFGLLRAPQGSEFILSDSAVITRVALSDGTFSIGEGFSKRLVHTLLPVSQRTCLQMGIPNLTLHTLTKENVDLINFDSLRLMHRWAYGLSKSLQIESLAKRFGGSVVYKRNAFVTPALTPERMLGLLVDQVVSELFAGRPSFKEFLARRTPPTSRAS